MTGVQTCALRSASLTYLLTSHVWRQDNNGFSHQDPGFIDHVVNKKADVIRVYLPPDANCLLSVTNHCLRSRNYVNVIVAGKQPSPQHAITTSGSPPSSLLAQFQIPAPAVQCLMAASMSSHWGAGCFPATTTLT